MALNPARKGNMGRLNSSQPLYVYDTLIAQPWLKGVIAQIRGEKAIPGVDAGDEKAVKKAREGLKRQLPIRAIHYYRFRNNHRSSEDADPESFLFQTTIDVDDVEYVDAALEKARELNCSIHILHIIHINSRLKEETFRIRILTRAVIIPESVIMNRTDRQLSFQRLLRLLHRLFITSIYAGNCLFPTYLRNHTLQPRLCYQGVIDIQGLGRVQSSHIALACRIQSHYLYCSHAIFSLKCLALPFISIISL